MGTLPDRQTKTPNPKEIRGPKSEVARRWRRPRTPAGRPGTEAGHGLSSPTRSLRPTSSWFGLRRSESSAPSVFGFRFSDFYPVALAALCLFTSGGLRAQNWRWSNPWPHGNNVVGLASQNGLTIQACDFGQLYVSADFHTWIPRDSHATNDLEAVTFFGNRILVTGANGTALYSDDGATFVTTNLATTDWLVGVASSSSLAVAVGDNAAIYSSPDGAHWTRQPPPPGVGGNWLLGVAYGAGTFVAVGEGRYIASSSNGTSWTQRTAPAGVAASESITYVAYINAASGGTNVLTEAGFLAVTDGGKAIFSADGAAWQKISGLNSTNLLFTATGNTGTRLLAGDQDVHLGTQTGTFITWPAQTGALAPAAPLWTYYSSLWDTNQLDYWLGGASGMLVQGTPTNALVNWQTPFASPRDWLWQVTTGADLYIAVGDNARVLTSPNGVNWTAELVPSTNSVSASNTVFFAVGGTTNLLLAVGTQGSVALSPNLYYPVTTTNLDGSLATNMVSSFGLIWYPIPAPTANDLHGVGVLGNRFYLVGGSGTLLSSANGTNWSTVATPTTAYLSSIETYSNQLVIVGDAGTILTSPNGSTWRQVAPFTTNWLYRVRSVNGTLVAVGEKGTILLSSDAAHWSPVPSGTTEWLNDLQTVGGTCYVVGTSGTVLASTNLTTWLNYETITSKSLYGAASQNGQLVVVGLEGAILRNQIVPDLTPVNFLSFNRASGLDVFLVAGRTDQQFTLDSSTNLVNWTTGPQLEILSGSGTLEFFEDTGVNAPSPIFYRATLVH